METKGYLSGFSMMSSVKSISSLGQYKCWLLYSSTFKISSSLALRNHGKCEKGRKYSFSLISIQNPCSDIFVTSISEVFVPGISDFIFMILNNFSYFIDLFLNESEGLRKFNTRFHPKLSFSSVAGYMNMYTRFFSGEEKETIAFMSKYSWTHY